jgi:hypothetical protein
MLGCSSCGSPSVPPVANPNNPFSLVSRLASRVPSAAKDALGGALGNAAGEVGYALANGEKVDTTDLLVGSAIAGVSNFFAGGLNSVGGKIMIQFMGGSIQYLATNLDGPSPSTSIGTAGLGAAVADQAGEKLVEDMFPRMKPATKFFTGILRGAAIEGLSNLVLEGSCKVLCPPRPNSTVPPKPVMDEPYGTIIP